MPFPFRALVIACLVAIGLVRTTRLWADEPAKAPAVAAKEAKDKDPSEAVKAAKAAADKARDAEEYELQKLFADTLDQVERNYVKNISRRELMEAAIRGVLAKLDPYSNYIGPEDLGRFKTAVDSEFGGIGIQVDLPRDGRLVVVSPLVGSPAYRAGLQAGDEIVEIEGESTDNIRQLDDAIRRLKGEAGSKVTITILRPSTGRRKKLTIEREVIQLETVMGDQRKNDDRWDFMLDHQKHIGYIRLTAFSRDTERDLRAALEELQDEHMRGLILDLRFNPGGLLTSAIAVADLFVADGRIVSTEGRNSAPRSWDAQKSGTFEGFPMVVLVNRYSASASEIVAACLQDHGRAVVIGERTWGKGSVQNVIELEGGKSALKLTTAGYQRPSGKNIHKAPDATDSDEWGVKPNGGLEVKLDDLEMARLAQYRHRRDILLVNHSPQPENDKAAPKSDSPKIPEEKSTDKKADENAPESKKSEAQTPEDKKAPPDAEDKKPGDQKPADKRTNDDKPAESKPADGNPDEKAKSQDGAGGDQQPDAGKSDAPKADGPADKHKDSPGDKSTEEKPKSPDASKTEPMEDQDGESKADDAKRPVFVDRQLQRAIDYLSTELAKADDAKKAE